MRPATIVGSANGRSISALTSALPRNSSRTSTQAISVPITASIAATIERDDQREPDRGDRLGVGDRVPELADAAVERAHDDGGERDQDDQRQPGDREAAHDERPAPTRRAPAGGRAGARVEAGPRSCASLGSGDTQVLLDLGHGALSRGRRTRR